MGRRIYESLAVGIRGRGTGNGVPAVRAAMRTGGSGIGVTAGTGGGRRGRHGRGGGPSVPTEIDGQLVINELMAANVLTAKDESGAAWPGSRS